MILRGVKQILGPRLFCKNTNYSSVLVEYASTFIYVTLYL